MVQVIQAKNLGLADLEEKFNLRLVEDKQFFTEWLEPLPEISDLEKQYLDRVKANYENLLKYPPLSENIVKMVVLSPLLDLAGFYRSPYQVKTEVPVKIDAEDGKKVMKGRIDVLVVKNQLWILVIESKSALFSLNQAIPQALAYMLTTPHPKKPAYGFMTNGSEFVFAKLVKQDLPQPVVQYALSDLFALLKTENELYHILQILKKLGGIFVNSES
jgi:hypothetical protein